MAIQAANLGRFPRHSWNAYETSTELPSDALIKLSLELFSDLEWPSYAQPIEIHGIKGFVGEVKPVYQLPPWQRQWVETHLREALFREKRITLPNIIASFTVDPMVMPTHSSSLQFDRHQGYSNQQPHPQYPGGNRSFHRNQNHRPNNPREDGSRKKSANFSSGSPNEVDDILARINTLQHQQQSQSKPAIPDQHQQHPQHQQRKVVITVEDDNEEEIVVVFRKPL